MYPSHIKTHLTKRVRTKGPELLLEVSTIRSMDVILPVKNRGQLRTCAWSPDQINQVVQMLAHLGLALPTSPKIIQNVVEKIA